MALPVIEGFDWKQAESFLGDADFIAEIASDFRDEIDEHVAMLENAIANPTDDAIVSDYAIKSHAIKSTLKMLGAMDLSEYARACEFAGKEKNKNAILSESPKLIEKLKWIKSEFANI